jgi:hypothetical protein
VRSSFSYALYCPVVFPSQAVYHNVKPASLQQQLEAVHVSPEKAEVFTQTWATAGPELVDKLRQTVFAPKKVIRWSNSCQVELG